MHTGERKACGDLQDTNVSFSSNTSGASALGVQGAGTKEVLPVIKVHLSL